MLERCEAVFLIKDADALERIGLLVRSEEKLILSDIAYRCCFIRNRMLLLDGHVAYNRLEFSENNLESYYSVVVKDFSKL